MNKQNTFGNLFLSIGVMKAGTTWLYSVLARNPALHFAIEKEIHYFYHRYIDPTFLSDERRMTEARNRYILRFDPQTSQIDMVRRNLQWVTAYLDRSVDDVWYRNLFHLRGKEVYACDFSNLHSHLPADAWRDIKGDTDKLRVLYTMRDPVRRLWSHTKFHLEVMGETDKLKTWEPDDYANFLRRPHIWNNAEYGAVLRKMREALAPEDYKVLFYEDLHADQRGTLRDIEAFLDVPSFDYPQELLDRRPTESIRHPMPDFFPELVADDVARIRTEIEAEGYEIPASWTV